MVPKLYQMGEGGGGGGVKRMRTNAPHRGGCKGGGKSWGTPKLQKKLANAAQFST